MLKKFIERTKKVFRECGETLKVVVAALIIAYYNIPVTAYASGDTGAYLKPLNNLKTIMLSIVATAGVIVLIFGIVRFAVAFQKMDQNGEHAAVYTMITGGIMAGAGTILAVLTA